MRRIPTSIARAAIMAGSLTALYLLPGCFSAAERSGASTPCRGNSCPTDAGPGTDATNGGGGTDATNSSQGIELMGFSATIDCSATAPAEPWSIAIEVRYNNSTGSSPFAALITSARISFYVPGVPELDLVVDPSGSGPVPAGEAPWVTHTAVTVTPDLPDECQLCGADAVLTLTYDVDGSTATVWAAADPTVACSY